MSNLVLELRQGDMMVLNGAAIRFRTRTRIELTAHARFLFGRQIMAPTEADTPARRIYFALQTAYIGDEHERREGLADAAELIEDFKAATTSASAVALLDSALACAKADKCYHALRLARRVVRHEDAVLGRKPEPARPDTTNPHSSNPDPINPQSSKPQSIKSVALAAPIQLGEQRKNVARA